MKNVLALGLLAGSVMLPAQELPPANELAFSIGGIVGTTRSPSLKLNPDVGLQANYAHHLQSWGNLALYAEVNLLASPLREVVSGVSSATRDVSSLYLTPGLRLKLFPHSRISPYALIGGGLAWYEQSQRQLDGATNPAPRELLRGAFDFGGGTDLRVLKFLALRGEVRDFYTGSPAFNLASPNGGQHNVSITGGLVVRWH